MCALPDFLGLPRRQRVPLGDRSPLVLAVCQVRFGAILSIADSSYVAPFQRAIMDDFPVARPNEPVQLSFSVASGQSQIQSRPGPKQWHFTDSTSLWQVVLAEDSVSLETREYANFDDFLGRLNVVLTALQEHIRPTAMSRVGLRYINEIRERQVEWSTFLNPLVLGLAGVQELSASAVNVEFVNQYQFAYKEQRGCNLRCGLLPQGTVLTNPLPGLDLDSPFFVLDIDVFREFTNTYHKVDLSTIIEEVSEYHEAIYAIFRWAVTSEFIKERGGDDL